MLALTERRVGSRGLQAPRGNPGVDPSHFASSNLLFSGVPLNSGFANLMNGKPLTKVSTPTESMMSPLGRLATFAGGGGSHAYTYAGDSTNYTSSTIAAIFSVPSVSSFQWIFSNNSNSHGVSILINSGDFQWSMFGVVSESSGITISANIPYFVVASQNGTTAVNYLVMQLDNGIVKTATSASSTPVAGNGTYVVGNGPTGSLPIAGSVAAVMYSAVYTPPTRLRQWAADPWAFWYPRR